MEKVTEILQWDAEHKIGAEERRSCRGQFRGRNPKRSRMPRAFLIINSVTSSSLHQVVLALTKPTNLWVSIYSWVKLEIDGKVKLLPSPPFLYVLPLIYLLTIRTTLALNHSRINPLCIAKDTLCPPSQELTCLHHFRLLVTFSVPYFPFYKMGTITVVIE